jgi:hypothetical protein
MSNNGGFHDCNGFSWYIDLLSRLDMIIQHRKVTSSHNSSPSLEYVMVSRRASMADAEAIVFVTNGNCIVVATPVVTGKG